MPLPFTSRSPRNDFYVLLDPFSGCPLSAASITRPQSKSHPRGNALFDPTRPQSRVGHALIKHSVVTRFRVPSISVVKGLSFPLLPPLDKTLSKFTCRNLKVHLSKCKSLNSLELGYCCTVLLLSPIYSVKRRHNISSRGCVDFLQWNHILLKAKIGSTRYM